MLRYEEKFGWSWWKFHNWRKFGVDFSNFLPDEYNDEIETEFLINKKISTKFALKGKMM